MPSEMPPGTHPSEPGHEKELSYRVQIDKTIYETRNPTPTGRQLLVIAGKTPPDQFALYEKLKGAQPRRIMLDQQVDLREEGVERFVTLPLDQTEGLGLRRDFSLPEEDIDWLERTGLNYELVRVNGVLRIVLYEMPVPSGYNVRNVAVNVRIEAGYPDVQIDMAYFYPALLRSDGRAIQATCEDVFDGKTWQRWSRHRTPANPWRPGIDNLSTHFGLIDSWLTRELQKV